MREARLLEALNRYAKSRHGPYNCFTSPSHKFSFAFAFLLCVSSLTSLDSRTATMNASDPAEVAEIAKSKAISHNISADEKVPVVDDLTIDNAPPVRAGSIEGDDYALEKTAPTDEELATLRRVAGKLPAAAYSVAFVELCERFSYYGTTAVCMKHQSFGEGSIDG
jgi:hypothetical protein